MWWCGLIAHSVAVLEPVEYAQVHTTNISHSVPKRHAGVPHFFWGPEACKMATKKIMGHTATTIRTQVASLENCIDKESKDMWIGKAIKYI
jgi:hypothetical protein